MRIFRNISKRIISLLGVAATVLSMSSCEDLRYVHEEGYVLYWRKANPEIVYQRPENLVTFTPQIKLLFWGKEPVYSATYRDEAKYEALCQKWGDTKFKGTRKILIDHPAYEYTSTDLGFVSMDLSINKDVKRNGEVIPAGSSLANVAELTFTTLKLYIDNGYKKLPDADYSAITEVDDQMFLYGYEKVRKLVSELTPDDLSLVGPYARISWMSKTTVPTVYQLTVTLTDEYGKQYTIVADIDPYNYN
ncbi:MAG: hypothetical protein J6R87_03730 [Rikenellaceae bacterium]|nr:hypothetical protein [Rikenellaceae bacterium]